MANEPRKFRKKHLVTAAQYDGTNSIAGLCTGECRDERYLGECAAHVHAIEGDLSVHPGDWILTGVRGEHWVCNPEIFAETYEEGYMTNERERKLEKLVVALDKLLACYRLRTNPSDTLLDEIGRLRKAVTDGK